MSGHDCENGPLEPSARHYRWHMRSKTAACDIARRNLAFYHWVRKSGGSPDDTDGFLTVYRPAVERRPVYDCGNSWLEPSGSHYLWHWKNKTTPCDPSRRNVAFSEWVRKGGNPNDPDVFLAVYRPRQTARRFLTEKS